LVRILMLVRQCDDPLTRYDLTRIADDLTEQYRQVPARAKEPRQIH
jgi:hypothetical protein